MLALKRNRTPDTPIRASVVMPSLNQGRFLGSAARSVLEQRCPGVELVVMDGGSTDGTLTELADLAAAYPGRLRWFSKPDGGPAEAINAAVAAARGALIGWLNADDLYAPGAIARSLRFLERRPRMVMVYGEARHIDAAGRVLGPYPTRPPDTPASAFADGCFICQPSVFFRRDAFAALGGLDTTLGAAFDFDLWLRFFERFPGAIGHLRRVQASSRLHDGAITLRMRERVALEGMRVLARHLGSAPAHWALTHFDELCALHPFHAQPVSLSAALRRVSELAAPYVSRADAAQLEQRIATDRNVAFAAPDFYLAVFPDGSAPPSTEIRIAHADAPITEVRLRCRHVLRKTRSLHLAISSPDAPALQQTVSTDGPFELRIPVQRITPGQRVVLRIDAQERFRPSDHAATSRDSRTLSFRVEACELVRDAAGGSR